MTVFACVVYIAAFALGAWGMWRQNKHLDQVVAQALRDEAAALEAERDFQLWEASL